MKTFAITPSCAALGLILWLLFSTCTNAQLEVVTNAEALRIFPGQARSISVMFHNPGNQSLENEIHTRILQTSSATSMPLNETIWKKLQVLPQQTVLESAPLDFPAVKAETKFLVQWLENTNRVIGRTEVWVYPTNLLNELKLLVEEGGGNLGVLDPKQQLKPVLKSSAIKFVDLAESELDAFSGKLALIGPCSPDDPEWSGLANRISKLASNGTPVVWIQSPHANEEKLRPSFYSVSVNTNAVVVVQPELVADLPDNPQSQMNLIYFCKLALNPLPPVLPDFSPP